MKSQSIRGFSEIISSREPSVWSLAAGIISVVFMLLALLINKYTELPDVRGFTIITNIFMVSLLCGTCGMLFGFFGIMEEDGKVPAGIGLFLSGLFWLLFYLNLGWSSCFNIVIFRDMAG